MNLQRFSLAIKLLCVSLKRNSFIYLVWYHPVFLSLMYVSLLCFCLFCFFLCMTRREVLFSNTASVIFAVSDPEEKNKKPTEETRKLKKNIIIITEKAVRP